MPLEIEQESEDLLRTALDRLRQRMDSGAYEQDRPYDVLDRILAAGAAGDTSYSSALDLAKQEAPSLLDEILGREAPILDRLNMARTTGRAANQFSGPTYLDGQLGQLDLTSGMFRPARLPDMAQENALPPGYSPSRFIIPNPLPGGSVDPGFFYAGSQDALAEVPESGNGLATYDTRGELAAREAYRQTPEAALALAQALPRRTTSAPKFDPNTAEAVPVKGMENVYYVPTEKGWTIRNKPSGDLLSQLLSGSIQTSTSGPPKITTKAEFDDLPSGTEYIGKDGRRYRKP